MIVSLVATEATDVQIVVSNANAKHSIGHMVLTFLVIGKEIAPTTLTPHLQGYLETMTKIMGSSLKKQLPGGICLLAAKGTAQDNIQYCSKEDSNALIVGKPMMQGARKDLEAIQLALSEGMGDKELSETFFKQWLRYNDAFRRYRHMQLATPKTWFPEIWILWGVTGSGKTRQVFEDNDPKDIWMWNGNSKFYQGYDLHSVAVFDDFYGEINLPWMLKLCDRYPTIVNIKNAECNWQPKKIYFTSNVNPRDWAGWRDYPEECKRAFFRRIKDSKGGIIHFGELGSKKKLGPELDCDFLGKENNKWDAFKMDPAKCGSCKSATCVSLTSVMDCSE